MAFKKVNHGFKIEATLLDMTDGGSQDISEYVESVMVRKRFIKEIFPLFVLDFKTTEELRDLMRDHDVKVHLTIYCSNVLDNTGATINEEIVDASSDLIFDDTIRIYDKPFVTTESKQDDTDETAESQENAAPLFYYRMSGVPESLVEKNEGTANGVFMDARLGDVIIYLLTNAGTENLVIQEPDNREVYTDIIVPPTTLAAGLYFLDSTYGVYSRGITFYMDYGKTYLFSPFSESLQPSSFVNIRVANINATNEENDKSFPEYDEDTGNIRYTISNLPQVNSAKDIIYDEVGTNTIFYTYDDNFDIVSRGKETTESYKKSRYFWNSKRLESFEDSFYQIVRKTKSLSIIMGGINPTLVDPLSIISIDSEYPEANGEYFISDIAYVFSTSDSKKYSCLLNLNLIKK